MKELIRALYLDGLRRAGLPLCATAEQLARYPGIKPLPECDAERAKAAAPRT